MKRALLITILLSVVSLHAQTTTPTWFKVATEGDTITSTSLITVRFGSTAFNCWSANLTNTFSNFSTTYLNYISVFKVPDPCVGDTKETDVLEGATPITITVNGNTVTVPAAVTSTTPPPPPPPTTVPIPVIFNGTKFSCSSIVLDNTGTLTLTCK